MVDNSIERLINCLSKLPGLGPRSARRAALYLLKRRETDMIPLLMALENAAKAINACTICANLDTQNPCYICTDKERDTSLLCVVEEVADLWALERTGTYKGTYHILGGLLSALDGIGPDDLSINNLIDRASSDKVQEVILATSATVDGQTTAHLITDHLITKNVKITRLAHGVPVGGELDYLDDGTLSTALKARRPL